MRTISHPLFSAPFRPLFLLASLGAILLPMLYVCYLVSDYTYYGQFFDVHDWHVHEMLFGFTPALLGGFILTAGSHWSGNPMKKGLPLIFLSSFWIIERLVLSFPAPPTLLTLVSIHLFFFYFLYLLSGTLFGNKKNYLPFMSFFFFLLLSKWLFSYGVYNAREEFTDFGKTMAIGLYRLILIWVAGRIIPFFIQKRFPEIKISIPLPLHYAAYTSTLLLIPLESFQLSDLFISAMACLAFSLNFIKLIYFQPLKSFREPLVLVLLIAYFFICLHLLARGLSFYIESLSNGFATLHLLTTGSLGLMALGMMVRVSLGHTGRKMKSSKLIITMFTFTFLGALIRALLPVFFPDFYYDGLHIAMGFWTTGFVIFSFRFFPWLFSPKL